MTVLAIRPIPMAFKTDYLWQEVLTRQSLTDIIENYALLVESADAQTGRRLGRKSGRAITSWMWCGNCWLML